MTKLNVFLVVAVALGVSSALKDDEKEAIGKAFVPLILGCADAFGISKDDLMAFKKTGDLDSVDSCFYYCVFNKTGVLSDDGDFDSDKATEMKSKFVSDPEEREKIAKINKICSAVNEKNVSNGSKACERAKMLLECYIKENNFLPMLSRE